MAQPRFLLRIAPDLKSCRLRKITNSCLKLLFFCLNFFLAVADGPVQEDGAEPELGRREAGNTIFGSGVGSENRKDVYFTFDF